MTSTPVVCSLIFEILSLGISFGVPLERASELNAGEGIVAYRPTFPANVPEWVPRRMLDSQHLIFSPISPISPILSGNRVTATQKFTGSFTGNKGDVT